MAPRNLSVLVAEDDDDLRESLSLILRTEGFRTASAANGAQALALLKVQRPDVVLLDLHMPVMDGFEFLQRRASDPVLSRIPVIAITGHTDPDPDGVVATLRKPFEVEDFLRVVGKGCG